MFFDIVLLNPQHRGNFSRAWIAATRGVKFVSKGQTKELDIPKLCDQLADFMISSSTDPKKRFSLRLSAVLLNGTIKLFRAKVLILEAEVLSCLHTIHVPSGMSSMPIYPGEASGILETPPTPRVTVKKAARGTKVVASPIVPRAEFVEGMLAIADVADVLRIQPTTKDMITLREDAPKTIETLIPEGAHDFGIITEAELEEEFRSLIPRPRKDPVVEPVTSKTVPSESPTSEPSRHQVVEVVALVHADKGLFIEGASIPSEMPVPMDMDEMRITTAPEVPEAAHLLVPSTTRGALPDEPFVDIVMPEETAMTKVAPRPQLATSETQPARVDKVRTTKQMSAGVKLFLSFKKGPFVRIDRCIEGSNSCVDEPRNLPYDENVFPLDNIFSSYWLEEDEEVREDVRPESYTRSFSQGRLTSTSKKSSLTEGHVISAVEPVVETSSNSKVDIQEVHAEKQLEVDQVPGPFFSQEPSIESTQPIVAESTIAPLPQDLPSDAGVTILPEEKREPPRASRSGVADRSHRVRQQNIIDILRRWNFDERPPTIEDVCEKPMTRLNMARAFSDLIVLCSKKFLELCTEVDSLKLKCIQLGPKLQ